MPLWQPTGARRSDRAGRPGESQTGRAAHAGRGAQGTYAETVQTDDDERARSQPPDAAGRRVRAVHRAATTGRRVGHYHVVVQSLATKARRVLVEDGRDARYVETGHLVYTRRGALLAVPFNLRTLSVTGGAVPLVDVAGEAMTTTPTTAGDPTSALLQFSLSKAGSLVYLDTGRQALPESTLGWVTRDGQMTMLIRRPGDWGQPRLSPDGRQVALTIRDPAANMALLKFVWVTLARFTSAMTDQAVSGSTTGRRVRCESGSGFWAASMCLEPALWKLTVPWTHRPRPPRLGKRRTFSTSFHRA